MRETRTSGSEGGGTLTRPPYPYPAEAGNGDLTEPGANWYVLGIRGRISGRLGAQAPGKRLSYG